jgi:excinuclease ABC subunit C
VLEYTLTFSADCDESFFQQFPSAAAVFALRGDGESYLSKTANLRRRLHRLLGPVPEQSKRLNLRDRIREVEFTSTGSDFESQFLLYRVLRETFPKTYAKRLRLRPAPFVKLHLENEYPRASVTTRVGKLRDVEGGASTPVRSGNARHSGEVGVSPKTGVSPVQHDASTGEDARAPKIDRHNLYYGPFPSRSAAEKFASDALDFFKMRRCVDDLHPDPSFPGCIYSEMKMCLAPCFKGCADDEYQMEVARVQNFFDSRGESLNRELAEQRERASHDLAFEDAAAAHARLEKLKPLLTQLPEIVRRVDGLDAILIQPSAEPDTVCLFCFQDAQLAGPVRFRIERHGHADGTTQVTRPRTMEARVEEAIHAFAPRGSVSSTESIEQLAILKRWYYRSNRIGEIFFADEKGSWPLRRIVRGIGRVYRGEKEQEPASFSATSNNAGPSEPE